MWIPILIIALVVAMAVGPIMWFRSTPAQRRIVAFRSRAAKLGLRVRLVSLADLDLPGESGGTDTIAAYGLPWIGDGQNDLEVLRRPANRPWRLVRQRISHEGHFAGWWDWQQGKVADRAWWAPLQPLITVLPPDAVALENDGRAVWLYFREQGGIERVARVEALLRRLKAIGVSAGSYL